MEWIDRERELIQARELVGQLTAAAVGERTGALAREASTLEVIMRELLAD